jgi:hypothetical protein
MKALKLLAAFLRGSLHRLVGRFGYVLIPTQELTNMERASEQYYATMRRQGMSERNAGYFNGLADYASKTATELRERHSPNTELTHPHERQS